MKQYIIRRLLGMIPILFGVTIIVFTLFKITPGDPLTAKLDPNMSHETKEILREQLGYNDPIPVQYARWLGDLFKGDMGESIYFRRPVGTVINTYIWNTVILNIVVIILSYLIAIPLGIISATKQYSLIDIFLTTFALLGISMPTFFFGLLMMKWFAVDLRWLPVSGMTTAGAGYVGMKHVLDVLQHLILPAVVLTLSGLAGLMRYTRTNMLEVINQDYIRTARAKGLKEKVVIYKHAFRNGMIPIATFLGFSLAGVFAGSIISERIFVWPGIGQIYMLALNNRDYALIMGYNFISAILVLLGNLLSDVLVALTDPRIRLS